MGEEDYHVKHANIIYFLKGQKRLMFDAEPYIAMPKMQWQNGMRDLPFLPELR
jgi:hypothetical protein